MNMFLSLHETERVLAKLWTNSEERDKFCLDNSIFGEFGRQIDPNGIALYASLIRHGYQDLMLSIFPYCAKLLGEEWQATVDRYMSVCKPRHYNLNRAASRFSQYLRKYESKHKENFPYIVELADYEWLELELLEAEGQALFGSLPAFSHPEQFVKFKPVANPILALRTYKHAIPSIVDLLQSDTPISLITVKQRTEVVVYRHPQSHQFKYLEIGRLTKKIISSALTGLSSYIDLLELAINLNVGKNPEKIATEFIALMEKLHKLCVFVDCSPI